MCLRPVRLREVEQRDSKEDERAEKCDSSEHPEPYTENECAVKTSCDPDTVQELSKKTEACVCLLFSLNVYTDV